MKNAPRYSAGPAYYRMCSTDVYCSKQTGNGRAKRKPSIISSFLELGRRKLSIKPKFVAAPEMLLKRNPANIRKWIARFITEHLYSAGSWCVLLTIIMICPSIWATLSALLINILPGFLPVVFA